MSAYPSIISQSGSASRNYPPILDAARPWIERAISAPRQSFSSDPKSDAKARVFEIGSYPYIHIKGFALEYPNVEWYGSARDEGEVKGINETSPDNAIPNLHPPVMLDISESQHWTDLQSLTQREGNFDGVFMFNVIHCCPEDLPERVFRDLSSTPSTFTGSTRPRAILREQGWIAVYGPFLNDDGTYKSPADEEFDRTYIRAKDGRLGLRSVRYISAYAEKWGFKEVERKEMPKGNMWVVWQRVAR